MAFSARKHESDSLSPPATRGDGDAADDAPTVITDDPLAPYHPDAMDRVDRDAVPEPDVEIDDSSVASASASTAEHVTPPDSRGSSVSGPIVGEPRRGGMTDQQTVISRRPPIADARLEQPSTPHELGQALVGKRLAHFELEEFLGGGMGAVFRGRDLTLGRSVAVKVLPRGQDEDTLRRFKNEAQSAARLNHENIARVYYVGEENGWNFIIFEYVEGLNIRALVEMCGPLPLQDAVSHTLQVAEALDHAYRRDVVHRDIKPSNLIVSHEGVTKLVDMGLARLHQVEASRNDLTASGVTLGTFDYISPEQARDPRTADVRSDIYSLGCTLYYMLAGRPPFPEGTVLQKLLDHQSRQPPDPRVFRPDLAEEAVAVLNRMLAKRPEDRRQTPAELIADLAALAERLGLPATGIRSTVIAASAPHPGVQNHLSWAAPTLALIAAVFAFEWYLRPSDLDREFSFPPVVAGADASVVGEAPETSAGEPLPEAEEIDPPAIASSHAEGVSVAPGPANDEDPSPKPIAAHEPPKPKEEISPPTPSPRSPAPSPPAGNLTEKEGDPTTSEPSRRAPSKRAPLQEASPRRDTVADAAGASPRSTPVRRLVVGDAAEVPPDPDVAVVETPAEVFRQLHRWPALESIELRFNGPQMISPFAVTRPLSIRAAEGFTPVLTFEADDAVSLQRTRHMISVEGAALQLEGVEMRWRLPAQPASAYAYWAPYDWALVLLDDSGDLKLHRCALTIENIGENGLPQLNGAAFVRLTSSAASRRPQEGPREPKIDLTQCIVRGEADFIAAAEAQPFALSWSEGLLATTEQLADVGLESERPGVISLDLDYVTIDADQGLCLLNADADAPHQLLLMVQADHCVFATGEEALIVHNTYNFARKGAAAWGRLLNWTGADNLRAGGLDVWRIDDKASMEDLTFNEGDQALQIVGVGPFAEYSGDWPRGVPSKHNRTPGDYHLDEKTAPAGFTPAALPPLFAERP